MATSGKRRTAMDIHQQQTPYGGSGGGTSSLRRNSECGYQGGSMLADDQAKSLSGGGAAVGAT